MSKENNAFSKIWIVCLVIIFSLCIYGLTTQTKSTYSASVLSGKWKWNDCIDTSYFTVSYPESIIHHIHFTSAAGVSYQEMWFNHNSNTWFVHYDDGNSNGSDNGMVTALFGDKNGSFYYDGQYYDKGTNNGKECKYFYTDDGEGLGYDPEPLSSSRSKSTTSVIDFGDLGQEVDADFYNWFTQNASPYGLKEVTITFKDSEDKSTIVPCYEYGEYGGCRLFDNHYAVKSKTYNGYTENSVFKHHHVKGYKLGYVWKGWKVDPDSDVVDYEPDQDITLTSDITLYPHFEAIKVVVRYEANGGSGTMDEDILGYAAKYKVKENGFTAPAGKVFSHWTDADGDIYTAGKGLLFDGLTDHYELVLYAQWEEEIIEIDFGEYKVDEKNVIMEADNTKSNVQENIKLPTGYTLKVTTLNNTKVNTGAKIEILKSDNTVYDEYTAVVLGDVDGDGDIHYTDYVNLYNHIQEVKNSGTGPSILTGAELKAADFNSDGVVHYTDYVDIYNAIQAKKGGNN